ncbi:uracil-DNA glycosylase [bacterium]|nr:uracil-DNA glycosylase [bacterium]
MAGDEVVHSQTKIDRLDEIAARIASCEICTELCKSVTNPVPGEGSPEADIMFVGEAPGAEEDRQGRPFVGASGKFLAEMLESIGLTREEVYITNIVKYRPPNNRDPFPDEIKACLPYLLEQIDIIQPKLVAFLGRHSMSVFFPDKKISAVHGQPMKRTYTHAGQKRTQVFLPLYHPAAALYNGGMRETLKQDFASIPDILQKLS